MALKALASPFKAFGTWYIESAQKHPFAVAFWTSGIKTSAADYIAQKVGLTLTFTGEHVSLPTGLY